MSRRQAVRKRALTVAVVLGLLGAACGQEQDVPIGMREYAANVVYSDGTEDPPPPPPPAVETSPGHPGFVAPPPPRIVPPPDPPTTPTTVSTTIPVTTTSTTVPPDCVEDDPLDVPVESPQTIADAPAVGAYQYRQDGSVTIEGESSPVQPELEHRLDNVEEMLNGSLRFDVAITESDQVTTTTYQISRSGAADGLYLVQIRTEDSVAIDAFTPSVPVQILPAPAVTGTQWSSSGVDLLTGVSMTINGTITGKTRVNACGTPLDAWLVEVGADPTSGQPSRISGPDKDMVITGTYAVSTYLGGLIVKDALRFEGTDAGREALIDRTAIINQTIPDPISPDS